jgi:hypothetical protein
LSLIHHDKIPEYLDDNEEVDMEISQETRNDEQRLNFDVEYNLDTKGTQNEPKIARILY